MESGASIDVREQEKWNECFNEGMMAFAAGLIALMGGNHLYCKYKKAKKAKK